MDAFRRHVSTSLKSISCSYFTYAKQNEGLSRSTIENQNLKKRIYKKLCVAKQSESLRRQ